MHWVSGFYFHLIIIKSDTTQELLSYSQACKTVALNLIYSLIETTFASIELTFGFDHMNSRLKQPSGFWRLGRALNMWGRASSRSRNFDFIAGVSAYGRPL